MKRDIYHAIADPTRRALVLLLAAQAMTPGALAEHFDTSRQAVSKHLHILMECGLLEPESQGREIRYHLKADKMHHIEKWLEQFKAVMATRYDQLDELLGRMKATRNNHPRKARNTSLSKKPSPSTSTRRTSRSR